LELCLSRINLPGFIDDINAAIDAYNPADAGAEAGDIATNQVRTLYNGIRDLMFEIIDLRDNRLPTIISLPGVPDLAGNETYDYTLLTDINNIIDANDIENSFATLLHHSNGVDLGGVVDVFTAGGNNELSTVTTELGLGVDDTSTDVTDLYPPAPDSNNAVAIAEISRNAAMSVLSNFLSAAESVLTAAREYETTFDNSFPEIFGFYKNALARITENLSAIPPSGALAGVYASIDATRGVLKRLLTLVLRESMALSILLIIWNRRVSMLIRMLVNQ
jgi:hypothetical protein